MVIGITVFVVVVFLNWDSLHVRLNSYYETWSYKKNLKNQWPMKINIEISSRYNKPE